MGGGGVVQMCPLIKKLFAVPFFLLFLTHSFIVQLGLGFKLITKLTLHHHISHGTSHKLLSHF